MIVDSIYGIWIHGPSYQPKSSVFDDPEIRFNYLENCSLKLSLKGELCKFCQTVADTVVRISTNATGSQAAYKHFWDQLIYLLTVNPLEKSPLTQSPCACTLSGLYGFITNGLPEKIHAFWIITSTCLHQGCHHNLKLIKYCGHPSFVWKYTTYPRQTSRLCTGWWYKTVLHSE